LPKLKKSWALKMLKRKKTKSTTVTAISLARIAIPRDKRG
jgi:hypothetical protein